MSNDLTLAMPWQCMFTFYVYAMIYMVYFQFKAHFIDINNYLHWRRLLQNHMQNCPRYRQYFSCFGYLGWWDYKNYPTCVASPKVAKARKTIFILASIFQDFFSKHRQCKLRLNIMKMFFSFWLIPPCQVLSNDKQKWI
jgi:hypothetical protein